MTTLLCQSIALWEESDLYSRLRNSDR